MIAWVFVEGVSDKLALEALWERWRRNLRSSGKGIQIIPLDDKTRLLRKLGNHAAAKLLTNRNDVVVALPDLYPNAPYDGTSYAHKSVEELQAVLRRSVKDSLEAFKDANPETNLSRFYPTALKYDLEMLLLAAEDSLKRYLKYSGNLGQWRQPVEDQNQSRPPKRVVEDIFKTRSPNKSSYRDTIHAPAVLRLVESMDDLFYRNGQLTCPYFKAMVDWLGTHFGVPGY